MIEQRYAFKSAWQNIWRQFNPTLSIQLIATGLIVIFGFYPAFALQIALQKDVAYAIARGAGAALKYLIPLTFVPTLRMIHANVYYRNCQKLLSITTLEKLFHTRFYFHRMLGIAIILAASLHIGAHVMRSSVAFLALESMTGILMMSLICLPISGAALFYSLKLFKNIQYGKKSYYSHFLIPHQLGWWALLAIYGFHTTDLRLLYSSLGIFAVFSFDRLWEWFKSHDLPVKKINKIHDSMIMIEMEKPKGYEYKTGEKAYLAYPTHTAFINKLHPFTIASSPGESVLRFVISASGDWSQQLLKTIKINDKVRVSPAFPSPFNALASKDKNQERLYISSGSGVAMTLAHLRDTSSNAPTHVIHISRQQNEFKILNQFLKGPHHNIRTANYYCTNTPNKQKTRTLKSTPQNVTVHYERFKANQNDRFTGFKGQVFFCGNDDLGNELEKIVSKDRNKKLIRERF